MRVWVYTSRRGEVALYSEDKRAVARKEQDDDNGCTWEDAKRDGSWIDGDPDEGNFSIDDGGSIELMVVQE